MTIRVFLIIACAFLWNLSESKAQSSAKSVNVSLETGILSGGQITSNTFAYHSGLSHRVSALVNISEKFNVGIGAGSDAHDFMTFIPIYATVSAKKNPEKLGAFTAYLGYALASVDQSSSALGREAKGGEFLELGRKWAWHISERFDFQTSLTFKHQFAELGFRNSLNELVSEDIDYNAFHLRVGLLIK